MATFTAAGSDIDKYDDIVLFPWVQQNLQAMGQFGQARRQTNINWHNEIGAFYYLNGGMSVETPPFDLANVDGDIIIMGHGNYGDRIAKDSGYIHSARSLAKLLADSGLPRNFANKIILWSCFAGVPGGMAQALAFKLRGRGYMTVQVWGCLWVTGNIANKSFLCVPNTTPAQPNGNAVEATLGHMRRY